MGLFSKLFNKPKVTKTTGKGVSVKELMKQYAKEIKTTDDIITIWTRMLAIVNTQEQEFRDYGNEAIIDTNKLGDDTLMRYYTKVLPQKYESANSLEDNDKKKETLEALKVTIQKGVEEFEKHGFIDAMVRRGEHDRAIEKYNKLIDEELNKGD